ncbi:MAG TPA: ATP-binding protein, partial [Bryobacteraceae bacterium]|nr:ATP-binding protein [Bryobacteraceae bacterium]
HEIRTPLNGVLGMTALLAGSRLDMEQKEMVKTVHQGASSLLTILNDILDFSKIEAGKFSIDETDLDLKALVEQVVALLRPNALEKGIVLELKWDSQTPRLMRGDPARIRQVLVNLVLNAIKFTAKGGVRVAVAKEQEAERLRITVIDSGIGIRPEAAKRLFQPFTQADTGTARKYGGTGLGLAICRQLTTLMGGEIGLKSEFGKGSAFWISLPLKSAKGPVGEAAEPARSAGGPVARILVVEDNPVNSLVTMRLLQKLGHTVRSVNSGGAACELVEKEAFDLIFMGVHMPEMDGLQATAEVRRREGPFRHTPIIALTASAMDSDRKRCLAAGMDDFLSKPLNLEVLAETVRNWLSQRQRS